MTFSMFGGYDLPLRNYVHMHFFNILTPKIALPERKHVYNLTVVVTILIVNVESVAW